MKGVVKDRVSIELLPGIPVRTQIKSGVILPSASVGLSEAGFCLVINVTSSTVKLLELVLGIFLPPPCLFMDTLMCFIAVLAAVVYHVLRATNIAIGLGQMFLQDLSIVCFLVDTVIDIVVDVYVTSLLLLDMSIIVLVCVTVYVDIAVDIVVAVAVDVVVDIVVDIDDVIVNGINVSA